MTRFRFIDLVSLVAISIALTVAAAAARRQAQDASNVAACAANLQQISQSLVLYQGLNTGEFPRTRYEADAPITAYTGVNARDPFAGDGPGANDVTAAAFLLVRTMDLPAITFICRAAQQSGLAAAGTFDRASAQMRSNFSARLNYNYSLANMYPDRAAVANGYSLNRFHSARSPDFAIAADTNPGGVEVSTATTQLSRVPMRSTNSANHERAGQNIAFADGHVDFFSSPFVGVNFDSVYASRAGFPMPADADDSVLLPVWSMGPAAIPESTYLRRWLLCGALIFTLGLLTWLVLHSKARDKRAAKTI